jgi:hypothetical protein
LLDWPLPAGCAGSKDDNGNASGSIKMVLPSPPKRRRNSDKDSKQVKAKETKRATAIATRVASNN